MADYTELTLTDGATVRLELAAVGDPPAADSPCTTEELPDGFGTEVPVGTGRGRMATLATDALRTVLSPLGPLLQEVHDSVCAITDPPDEISVVFGVQIGQDLKIGIVGAQGQAAMTVSATWRTDRPQG
ncbi:CU044_2847 family protein [Streptomyces sp. NBC_00019]|uniref:CU044_2847 family protein n=1 Tax=Streptomyces sp. NBC_00019 TaxID=2975623 RepID=UPI003246B8AB